MIDLHIHSKYSDGKFNIEEIVEKVKENDISILSITDHDNLESSVYIEKNIIPNNMIFIPGIELSTESFYFGSKMKLHLLGYGFDYKNLVFNKALEELYCRRFVDNQKYIEKIISLFNFINFDMFYGFDYGKFGWIRKLILEQVSPFIGNEDKEKLENYLNLNKPMYHYYNFKIEDAIELISNAGGLPVMAHPFQLSLDNKKLKELVEYLKKCGLKGIETYHNDSTIEQSDFYHRLALEYELLESVGSDFHDGVYGVKYRQLNELDNELVKKLVLEKKIIGGNYGRK